MKPTKDNIKKHYDEDKYKEALQRIEEHYIRMIKEAEDQIVELKKKMDKCDDDGKYISDDDGK